MIILVSSRKHLSKHMQHNVHSILMLAAPLWSFLDSKLQVQLGFLTDLFDKFIWLISLTNFFDEFLMDFFDGFFFGHFGLFKAVLTKYASIGSKYSKAFKYEFLGSADFADTRFSADFVQILHIL